MVVYCTRHSEYSTRKIEGFDVITGNRGELEGKLYKIVGFLDRDKIEFVDVGVEIAFYKKGERDSIPYDDLPKFLDQSPSVGRHIVGRHVTESGLMLPVNVRFDIILTSVIQEIQED
ncbi:hypothetical protein KW805_01365 [Candidatus Pacearchaeota archaeon]|nr:hypothetical protein [Candidatus Pacearchaeota archaeon]